MNTGQLCYRIKPVQSCYLQCLKSVLKGRKHECSDINFFPRSVQFAAKSVLFSNELYWQLRLNILPTFTFSDGYIKLCKTNWHQIIFQQDKATQLWLNTCIQCPTLWCWHFPIYIAVTKLSTGCSCVVT